MKIRNVAAVALVALTAVSLTACRGSSPTTNTGTGNDTLKIMVGGIDKVIYMPAMLTQQLGYFKDEGLTNLQLLDEQSGVSAEDNLVAGQLQGVVGFYDHTIDLQTKGACLESVVQLADIPGESIVVPINSPIQSPADFRGKKMGVTSSGSSTDFLTQYLAGKAGVTTKDYTTVAAGAGANFISSLERGGANGGIDAGMTTDPTVATLVNSGKGKVLFSMRTLQGTQDALGGLYPASSLYMPCDFVNNNKPTVQKLANAFVKTLRWMSTHTSQEIAAKMPPDYAKANPSLYEQAINDSKSMFNNDGKMKTAGAQNVLNVLSQFSPNVKPKKDTIDLSKTYTTEFVDKVPAQ